MTRRDEARMWSASATRHVRECPDCGFGRLCWRGHVLDKEADAAWFRTNLPEREAA